MAQQTYNEDALIEDALKKYEGRIQLDGKVLNKSDIEDIKNIEKDFILRLSPIDSSEIRYKFVVEDSMIYYEERFKDLYDMNNGSKLTKNIVYGKILEENEKYLKIDVSNKYGEDKWKGWIPKSEIIKKEVYND